MDRSLSTQVCAPKQIPIVNQVLDSQVSAIDRMSNLLSALIEKLNPVLRNEPQCEKSCGDRTSYNVPLAECICKNTDRITGIADGMDYILRMIEV